MTMQENQNELYILRVSSGNFSGGTGVDAAARSAIIMSIISIIEQAKERNR